jgi:pyridoxine 5-phosphate synthase
MIHLGVNIDHCATLRQARYRDAGRTTGGEVEPDPVTFALCSERAGADGITVHLREDRRHIQERDVWRLRESIGTRLNLEMACTPAMIDFALKLKPEFVCVVPESRQEVTTEGGLDVVGSRDRVRACVEAMNAAGIKASLFIDADLPQIELSAQLGAPFVELHTGAYANAYHSPRRGAEFERLRLGCERAKACGLTVNAGHGINYVNVVEVRTLPHLYELNIGHSIVSRAVFTGVDEAVREMKARMNA